jgi:hypothetical protein
LNWRESSSRAFFIKKAAASFENILRLVFKGDLLLVIGIFSPGSTSLALHHHSAIVGWCWKAKED